MSAARFEQMAEHGECRIDGIEQPEIGDIGGGEIGQRLVLLAPQTGDGARAGREDLHQAAGDGHQVIVGEEIEQRLDDTLSQEPVPLLPDYQGTALFRFKDIQSGADLSIVESYLVTVYAVETQVSADKIVQKPSNPPALMADCLKADSVVPADDPRIKALARNIVGAETNPWRETRLVWDWVEKNLTWSPLKEHAHCQDVLVGRSGDSYSYALLTCAILRAAGVPARPIAGYLIDPNRRAVRHYWLEVFIYGLGWVPLDPVLGSGASPGGLSVAWDDRSRYLGNVDDRHLAFSRGFSVLAPMAPDGRRMSKERRWSFQSFYEEATKGIEDYSSYWGDIEVTGLY